MSSSLSLIVTLKSTRKRLRERERDWHPLAFLASLSRVQSERWRIIIWIERHGWRGKFNMQIARHYASFIPVFRPWRGEKGREEASAILRLVRARRRKLSPCLSSSKRPRVGLESWWMKRGSERDSWIKGKTRWGMDVDEESPNVVLHIRFITPRRKGVRLLLVVLPFSHQLDVGSANAGRNDCVPLFPFRADWSLKRWGSKQGLRREGGKKKKRLESFEGSGARFPSSGVI